MYLYLFIYIYIYLFTCIVIKTFTARNISVKFNVIEQVPVMQIPPVQAPAGGVIVSGPYGSERVGCVGKRMTSQWAQLCVYFMKSKTLVLL